MINRANRKYLLTPFLLLLLFACSTDKSAGKKSTLFNAESVLQEANEKMKKGYYEDARKILKNIQEQDSSGQYIPLAQLRIGDTYFEENLYEEATIEYEHFLKINPYHKFASYAQYQLAMSYFNRIKTIDVSYSTAQAALREFEKLLNVYPRNPYVNVVENRIKMCKRVLAEYEFYVGNFYFKKGSYGAAVMRFNTLILNYPDSMKEPDALYYLGLSYKKLKENEKAQTALTTLIKKYPATKLSQEAKEILASLNNKK
jgi:outer membrane protein assembly factor BamD